ncbi:MAG TPA: ABC transporter permease [Devosiaceae bacterium]|jgi:simple sugar transport system permease protein
MSPDYLIAIFITVVGASTPLLFAGLGELVAEKSGVLNLGVEGMMLVGAIAAFATVDITGNPWLAVVMAAFCAAAVSMIFAVLTLSLSANQVATGLALTIFGTGLSSLVGQGFTGRAIKTFGTLFPEGLANDRFGRVIFGYSPLVYLSFIMVILVAWFLKSTRGGLILRAVGENDVSAHSIGYSVIGVRYAAVAFGGAMAGIGGASFPLVLTPLWAEGLTGGRGWIALALVVFAGWRPYWLLAGAYFFGLLGTLELYAKASGGAFTSLLPSEGWAAVPYLATVIALAVISVSKRAGGNAPACLGKPFIPAA